MVLGKIKAFSLGFNDRGWFGWEVELETQGGNVIDGRYVPSKYRDTFAYSPEDWSHAHRDNYGALYTLMDSAGVTRTEQLVGKPVEVEYEGNMLKGWRILTEVL